MRVITLLLLILVWWNTLALAADEVADGLRRPARHQCFTMTCLSSV